MAGNTPWYSLAFFDFGDRLDSQINVQREIDRFLMIDKQLYGLYNVFGNGVINGWDVFSNGFSTSKGIAIGIAPGRGIINYIAAETVVTQYLLGLQPNSALHIYAVLKGSTVTNRYISFTSSLTDLGDFAIKIATVITGESGILSIDNTVKDYISFEQTVLDNLNDHKHRGVPPKIDLTREVKDQLPSSKIEYVDTAKLTSGKIPVSSLPILNHGDLLNSGVLSHAQIDSILGGITDNNDIFGISLATNYLKLVNSLKLSNSTIDQYFVNQFSFIPGVSSSDFVDTVYSTALLDTTNNQIVGINNGLETTSYFFTNNFSLPSNIAKLFLVTDKVETVNGNVVFGVSTTNSVSFDDYAVLSEQAINEIIADGSSLRIGIKFHYDSDTFPDPYSTLFEDFIDFGFVNESNEDRDFHFRIRFYTDALLTNLYYTAFSQNDRSGWLVDDSNPIPENGYAVASNGSILVTYNPDLNLFSEGALYYIVIDIWDGDSFVSSVAGYIFTRDISSSLNPYAALPRVNSFSFIIELENKELILLNI